MPKVLNNAMKLIEFNQPKIFKLYKESTNQDLSTGEHVEENSHNYRKGCYYTSDYSEVSWAQKKLTIKDMFKLPMGAHVEEN